MGTTNIVFSHWYTLIENFQFSPLEFYARVNEAIQRRGLPKVVTSRIDAKEGGMFSANREYLRAVRKEFIFDICGAPFGTGFFISWWLGSKPSGCLGLLIGIPLLGYLFRIFVAPLTYHRIDTALMFMQSVHNAVLEVIDDITKAQGIRALSESERKPILREFYQR